jgi:uncharacterized integral membrane protein
MTSFVSSARGRWIFSILVTNLSVGLVLLILAVAGQFPTAHVFFRTLAYTLIFANLTGILGMAIIGAITERLARRQLPVVAVSHRRASRSSCRWAVSRPRPFSFSSASLLAKTFGLSTCTLSKWRCPSPSSSDLARWLTPPCAADWKLPSCGFAKKNSPKSEPAS